MKVAIITNTDNGKGLQRDAELLAAIIRSHGHTCAMVHFQKAPTPPRNAYDLAIFLEVGGVREQRFHACAKVKWLIPNAEWWEPLDSIDPFDRVLVKTIDAERVFCDRKDARPGQVAFLGFESDDRSQGYGIDPDAVPEFLHIAGGSTMKGTQTILDAWHRYHIEYPLTLVTTIPQAFRTHRNPKVAGYTRLPDERLAGMQRRILFHLQPSAYEGFGHVLHEGLSVGALVVTTAGAPMNESPGVLPLVRTDQCFPLKSARVWGCSPLAILDAVTEVSDLRTGEVAELRQRARAAFVAERAAFRDALARELEAVR